MTETPVGGRKTIGRSTRGTEPHTQRVGLSKRGQKRTGEKKKLPGKRSEKNPRSRKGGDNLGKQIYASKERRPMASDGEKRKDLREKFGKTFPPGKKKTTKEKRISMKKKKGRLTVKNEITRRIYQKGVLGKVQQAGGAQRGPREMWDAQWKETKHSWEALLVKKRDSTSKGGVEKTIERKGRPTWEKRKACVDKLHQTLKRRARENRDQGDRGGNRH